MSLDVILGPMFSGKTTELIRRLTTLSFVGKKCIFINNSLDNREKTSLNTKRINGLKLSTPTN